MSRFARTRPVFIFEEWIPCDHPLPYLEFHRFPADKVTAVRPRMPHWWNEAEREAGLRRLLDELLALTQVKRPVLWFYTPMMFGFASHIDASAVIYDCMDELSAFRFAPPRLKALEAELIARADAVFTGGYSIYEAKADRHDNIHPFPSSVDTAHFAQARGSKITQPADQAGITGPRLGYYGVIDERIDLDLIAQLAKALPQCSIIMVGPVVKVDPAHLPRAKNIHYLGQRSYGELPAYLAGWDVALMPFAINEATRFISPTKTPEYLAGGKPVVSTAICDVERHYGDLDAVTIARNHADFIAGCRSALTAMTQAGVWLAEADALLATMSWDETFGRMTALVNEAVANNNKAPTQPRFPAPRVKRADRSKPYDYLVVGAGFAGSVLAERLAAGSGKRVLVCDKRPHVAGNAYDHYDEHGVLVHRYGPHIFHTNSEEIFAYLSRFTRWRAYEHRVLADVGGKLLPMPINRTTLNGLYGLDLRDEAEAAAFLSGRAEPVADIRTSRDVVVSAVGTDLYETFFQGYTRKQWGLDPSELDKSVTARVPTRTSTDDRYFLDTYQAMPADGFTAMFETMLDHPNITLELGVDFEELRNEGLAPKLIFTGPIDAFYGHRFGALPYRSLRFQHETLDKRRFQPVAVVNYPLETVPYTRVTEYKYLTGQVHPKTSISYEFACAEGDPYYPIPRPENQALFKQYEALARAERDVTFVGRLGTYRYYNMDQVVGQALATHRRLVDVSTAVEAAQ